jgi:hypothetical protein
MFAIAAEVEAASAHRPQAYASGRPGDVYLCHPFLVHATQPHQGRRHRFMAQPPLHPAVPYAPSLRSRREVTPRRVGR